MQLLCRLVGNQFVTDAPTPFSLCRLLRGRSLFSGLGPMPLWGFPLRRLQLAVTAVLVLVLAAALTLLPLVQLWRPRCRLLLQLLRGTLRPLLDA